jgi:LPXTG-motif cell wall-anchored protein
LSTLEPIVLTVDGNGLVQKAVTNTTLIDLNSDTIRYTTPYNVTVTNTTLEPLPETGGVGTHHYILSGLLLMSAALWMILLKRKYIGREVPADV